MIMCTNSLNTFKLFINFDLLYICHIVFSLVYFEICGSVSLYYCDKMTNSDAWLIKTVEESWQLTGKLAVIVYPITGYDFSNSFTALSSTS